MDKDLAKIIGKNLRRRRKQLDLTLREVSEKADVSIGFLGNAEHGMITPSIPTAYRVSKVLGITINDLIDGSEKDVKEET